MPPEMRREQHDARDVWFAAVGDVHGSMHAMVRLLQGWEAKAGRALSFVLQVGDFEPIRHAEDLATVAGPAKYRRLGDFPDFHAGRTAFPWPVYFIGGNHEPYGLLDRMLEGGEVAENCFYLGRAGMVEAEGLRVAGLTGIYSAEAFEAPRPGLDEMGHRSRKDWIYFTKEDVDRAAGFGSADVLLVHEWPERVVDPADAAAFHRQRRSPSYDLVGNEYARLLMELLEPRLVLCGHMHRRYRNRVRLESGALADVYGLANVDQGSDSAAVFHVTPEGSIVEVWPECAGDVRVEADAALTRWGG
jgi:lariat debranching enzyme